MKKKNHMEGRRDKHPERGRGSQGWGVHMRYGNERREGRGLRGKGGKEVKRVIPRQGGKQSCREGLRGEGEG